jgi:hypothetical protein
MHDFWSLGLPSPLSSISFIDLLLTPGKRDITTLSSSLPYHGLVHDCHAHEPSARILWMTLGFHEKSDKIWRGMQVVDSFLRLMRCSSTF